MAKTGRFFVRSEMVPGLSEEALDHTRRRMWHELAEPIIEAMTDGRVYSVMYTGLEYEDEGPWGPRCVFDFQILLYVANAVEAKVGELVWGVPAKVPDELVEWRAPWGAVFERTGEGWRRIE